MKISIGKAWILGGVIVLVGYGAWFIALQANEFSEVLMLLLWGTPTIAAFVVGYLAPRRKILLGASMALLAASLAGVLNFTYEVLGNAVDFPRVYGGLILIGVTFVTNGVLCTLGAALGCFLALRSVEKGAVGVRTTNNPVKTHPPRFAR
jgi:hypothetical protein